MNTTLKSHLRSQPLWLPIIAASSLVIANCQSTSVLQHEAPATEPSRTIDYKVWFAAAEEGDAGILESLLAEGVDPRVERQGLTALHIVVRQGYFDATKLLLDAGVEVNLEPNETEAQLAAAAGHGNPRMLEMMTGTKPDPDAVANASNLRSPLNLAVENGHGGIVALLIAHGANVNSSGEWYSPLHSAVLYGDASTVGLLLKNGARVNSKIRIPDRSKFSGFRYVRALEVARIIERDDLVELLQRYGGKD